ncbi:MAG TPA: hypothetical protein VHW70_03230 [Edaphobacter sp.]|jgi:hypothetical protein|nr:hypothetical protein [Edaphobacter sp.]
MSQTKNRLFFRQILVYGVAFLVPCIFYYLLARTILNLPILDDYDSILSFLNHYSQLPSASGKVLYIFTAQHNEYKLIFEHWFVVTEFDLLGHVNFVLMIAIGNLSVLLLGVALWKMLFPQLQDDFRRLTLFLPVIFLLFQLQYYENLTWPTTTLQNIPVVPFSLFSLYFLLRKDRRSATWALLLLALAVFTSGNGFMAVPVGLLILFYQKRWHLAILWLCLSALLTGIYFFRYNHQSSQSVPGQSVFAVLFHFNLLYFLSFVGSAAESPTHIPFHGAAMVFGIIILFGIGYAIHRGYHRRNPFLAAACLFVLLTGIAVSGLRSDFGVVQSLSSRYRIYSDLLLIFAYIFLADEFLQPAKDTIVARRLYLGALVASFAFCFVNDWIGYHSMIKRHNLAIAGMHAFLHPSPTNPMQSPVLFDRQVDRIEPGNQKFVIRARSILIQSIDLGIYRPADLNK